MDISDRYGAPAYFEDSFRDLDRSELREDFTNFHTKKVKGSNQSVDDYEASRQKFLRLLGQHKMMWQSTNEELDLDVDTSRIYCHDRNEYLAFMRIKPRGFRGQRLVPAGVELLFHVLIGTVIFVNKKRARTMTRGHHTTVLARTSYSIRCPSENQPAYLIFRMVTNKGRSGEKQ